MMRAVAAKEEAHVEDDDDDNDDDDDDNGDNDEKDDKYLQIRSFLRQCCGPRTEACNTFC